MKIRRRFDSKINSITSTRWTAYAAAASGSAAAHTAEGTIHYSGLINQKIGPRDTRTFQLDPAGGSFEAGHFNYVGGSSNFNAGGVASLYFHGALIGSRERCYVYVHRPHADGGLRLKSKST